VWAQLELRHVKLEQIHRQNDGRFQSLLNKIRNGVALDPHEWFALEQRKSIPSHVYAIRLMSRKIDVENFNAAQLRRINSTPMSWKSLDTVYFLGREKGNDPEQIRSKIDEYTRMIGNYHRSPTELCLKIGAKVVLLHNLDLESGLVNGSQGEVVAFQDCKRRPGKMPGRPSMLTFNDFLEINHSSRPVILVANGCKVSIPPITQSTSQGSARNRYLLSQTQIPLALGWALSIHKSQGMTLDHAEVSSRHIF
jgi:ATP-dependent DNA helicase PIF1